MIFYYRTNMGTRTRGQTGVSRERKPHRQRGSDRSPVLLEVVPRTPGYTRATHGLTTYQSVVPWCLQVGSSSSGTPNFYGKSFQDGDGLPPRCLGKLGHTTFLSLKP